MSILIPHFAPIGGVEIRVSNLLAKEWAQVRFPKSKRKRIRKKWRKDRRNWDAVEPLGVAWRMPDGSIITNRRTFEAMRRGWRGSMSVGQRVRLPV